MPFACDNEDGNDAVVLLTNLESSEVMRLCGVCMPQMVGIMADTMGVAKPEGGLISEGQLVALATGREQIIDGLKGSKPVKEARLAELQTVIYALAALIDGKPLPEGTMPDGGDGDPDTGPGDPNTVSRDTDSELDDSVDPAAEIQADYHRDQKAIQEDIDAGVERANADMDDSPGY